MTLKGYSVCVSLSIFAFLIKNCDGLQCYNCQAAVSDTGEDPCKYSKLESCPLGTKYCLSAKFSISAESPQPVHKIVSAQSCFPDMNGQECDFFLETVQKTTPSPFKIRYQDKCKLCTTDGCNSASTKNILSGFLFLITGGILILFSNIG